MQTPGQRGGAERALTGAAALRLVLGAILAVLAVAWVVSRVGPVGEGGGGGTPRGVNTGWGEQIGAVERFPAFAVYAPPAAGRDELWSAARELAPGSPGTPPELSQNSLDLSYGECRPDIGMATMCVLDALIRIYPACVRGYFLYSRYAPAGGEGADGGLPFRSERVDVGNATALDFGDRIEIFTGRVTVVVSALDDNRRRLALARSLVPRNALARLAAPDGVLPAPVPGALEGTLACDLREWGGPGRPVTLRKGESPYAAAG